ncbi:hypothetical protein QEZ54_24155 [Catellatospora sp. KI3]|uniref:hypothetical protein n=1 Tax=Catellatospora sp. KI3 TaxID=3041620 RepID=UPI002482E4AF|nr:hypothetical protein [Catellatospora sp. KI3]MDI1464084.1 hypothetical protein [Catellatospora sp. KI3]
MTVTPRARAIMRTLALALLASLAVAFGFGRAGSDDDLASWWDAGARLSPGALSTRVAEFYGDDAVSRLFAWLTDLLAQPGLALWNAVTASVPGRWLALGVAGAVAVDSAKNGLAYLLRKPQPEEPPAA